VKRRTVLYHYGDTSDSDPYAFVADEVASFAKPRYRYLLF